MRLVQGIGLMFVMRPNASMPTGSSTSPDSVFVAAAGVDDAVYKDAEAARVSPISRP